MTFWFSRHNAWDRVGTDARLLARPFRTNNTQSLALLPLDIRAAGAYNCVRYRVLDVPPLRQSALAGLPAFA